MKHLIFYDGTCPLCHRAVRFILGADRKKIFYFAALAGITAQRIIGDWQKTHPKEDTLVLLENFDKKHPKQWIEGKAILRICWLLGGKYKWIGWLSFLPPFLFNIVYRWIAKRRVQLFSQPRKPLPTQDERFLP